MEQGHVEGSPALAKPPADPDRPGLGIALATLAMLLFASMDAVTKHVTQQHPVPQILFVRYWVFLACAVALAAPRGGLLRQFRSAVPTLQVVRSLVLILEIGAFNLAFSLMPLADTHAVAAVAPLLATALSVPMLGERVGRHRWAAVALGFVGVLIVVRPGMGVMDAGAPFALAGAALWALYQVLVRRIGHRDTTETTLLYTATTGALVCSLFGPSFWVPPDAPGWGFLLLVGLMSFAGHSVLILALRAAPASLLQPFGYMLLVWATVMGWLVFGDLPDGVTVLGAAIVVAGGLYAVHRERRRALATG